MKQYFIPFNRGGGAVVDWDFTNPIHCLNWCNSHGYAIAGLRIGKKTKHIRMHQLLLNFPEEVDHINGQRNDNRIINLRSVSHRQNGCNQKCHREGKLVGSRRKYNKWESFCHLNGKYKYIGMYDTQIEAHIAYVMYLRGIKHAKRDR